MDFCGAAFKDNFFETKIKWKITLYHQSLLKTCCFWLGTCLERFTPGWVFTHLVWKGLMCCLRNLPGLIFPVFYFSKHINISAVSQGKRNGCSHSRTHRRDRDKICKSKHGERQFCVLRNLKFVICIQKIDISFSFTVFHTRHALVTSPAATHRLIHHELHVYHTCCFVITLLT